MDRPAISIISWLIAVIAIHFDTLRISNVAKCDSEEMAVTHQRVYRLMSLKISIHLMVNLIEYIQEYLTFYSCNSSLLIIPFCIRSSQSSAKVVSKGSNWKSPNNVTNLFKSKTIKNRSDRRKPYYCWNWILESLIETALEKYLNSVYLKEIFSFPTIPTSRRQWEASK